MFSFLLAVQIVVSISIIALVMLQQGKGADMGAGFGAGASGTVFGSRGSGSFFTRATAILAAVFFINCLLIASPLVRNSEKSANTLADQLEQQAVQLEEAEKASAVVNALENQETDAALTLPAETVETVVVEDDVPDVPALDTEPAISPEKSDLPE
jgi:preprotein translocase subunit SecG